MKRIDDPQAAERRIPLDPSAGPKKGIRKVRAALKAAYPKRTVPELRRAMKDGYDALEVIEKSLGGTGGPVDPGPVDPDPVDPGPVDPAPGKHLYEDPIWGGEIGAGDRRVVEGDKAEWKGRQPSFSENTDYVNPKIWGVSDDDLFAIGDRLPTGVRLFNPIFENISAPNGHAFYWNMGHAEAKNQIRFVIFGGHSKNIRALKTWAEFKAGTILVEDHEVDESCRYGQYIRMRHSRQLVAVGGRSHGVIAVRGWCHYVDVPGAIGQSRSGPLPYRFEGGPGGGWGKLHDGKDSKWAGKAWQGTEGSYFGPSLSSLQLGEPSESQPNNYPSLDCIVHPDLKARDRVIERGPHKGTRYEALSSFRELWAKYGLLG